MKANEQSLLKDIQLLWSAENMLVDTLPMLIEKATNDALKMSLAHHLAETTQHKVIMDFFAKQFDVMREGNFNDELKNLLQRNEDEMNQLARGDTMDEAIIKGSQKVEQYEMAAYTAAAVNAEMLGHEWVAAKMRWILEEERQAHGKLNFLLKNLEKQSELITTHQ